MPVIFPLLKGPRGGVGLGRQAGGVGPFWPWLKPQMRTTLDETGINPDGWRLPSLPKPILFALKTKMSVVLRARARPLPALGVTITGVSRDSTGTPLAGCTCTLFRVTDAPTPDPSGRGGPVFTQVAVTTSDGSGNYSFVVGFDGPYRVTFDLAGAPVRAGLTLKTLAGT